LVSVGSVCLGKKRGKEGEKKTPKLKGKTQGVYFVKLLL
jgi:hypothetical protein